MLRDKNTSTEKQITAADILGNPKYLAISYGGYRQNTRDIQPTMQQLKDDMNILYVMGIRVLRTYNVQLQQAQNLLKAIRALKAENPSFEMYVMLGAWIDCKNAWTGLVPDHEVESEHNASEIDRAVALAQQYPDIVKVLAVGNEAMVHWATSYFVRPNVILRWVNHVQNLKKKGELPKDLWVTSSDDFSSWGGGDSVYHTEDLNDLIRAVDYISMHTYPMHNSYYNPGFWTVRDKEIHKSDAEKIESAMQRAMRFSQRQFDAVVSYMRRLGINKPVHIGETGWATRSSSHYDKSGSRATDEYKSGRYYELLREWTNSEEISCFYFEAFDEPWKDANDENGSENHFGLFTVDGKAKYAIWDLVDKGIFKGLTRDGNKITKTYNGEEEDVLKDVLVPPRKEELILNH